MGLTGLPVVLTLAVVAFGAVVICVRAGGRGLVRRILLVSGTELALTAAALAVANAGFGFFSSWSDLLGAEGGRITVSERQAGEPAPRQIEHTRGDLAGAVPRRDGRLEAVVVHGPRSGLYANAIIYLPPQYSERAYRHTRFPVVLMITSDVRGLASRLPRIVAGGIARHVLRPTVYAMVGPVGCVDVPAGRQYATFLSEDVPSAMAGEYRVTQGWGVLGDASGGYCAAALVLEHSDRFAAGVSAAPGYAPPPGDYGRSSALRDENDLTWRLRNRPQPPADLTLVVTGTRRTTGPPSAIRPGASSGRPGGDVAAARRTIPATAPAEARTGTGVSAGTAAGGERAEALAALARPPLRAGLLGLPEGSGPLVTWRRDLLAVLARLDQRLGVPGR